MKVLTRQRKSAAAALCFAALAICLLGGWNIAGLIPAMPYWCGAILALSFAALTVLLVVDCVYYAAFLRQLVRSFGRFQHNALASVSGEAALPALAIIPQFSAKTRRRLRAAALISLALFAACFVLSYVVCALSAGSLQFWHAWGWFQNRGAHVMYGLNAVALVFFGCINVVAYQLYKCPEGRRRTVVRWLCAVLLSGNLLRYGVIYPFVKGVVMLPVEFSTVAYFLVPAILLTSKRRLRSWAAYSGLMAGFFYYLAMIAAGGVIYGAYAPLDIYISMFCHGSIYFCGFVTIGTELCSAKDAPKLALGVALVAIRAAILRPFVVGSDRLLIYILLDAVAVKRILPESAWTVALPFYYLAVAAFVLLTIRGFFRRNQKQYHKFLPRGEAPVGGKMVPQQIVA